ncbi:MAG: triose-phosphate isomerase, partial [Thermoleophilaceae bacterium]
MTPDPPEVPRRPAIIGNWKLWGTRAEARPNCERLLELLPDEPRRPASVGICPPFTSLDVCVETLRGSGVAVYAQNMNQHESGAFTGEISAAMLREIGVYGVVLGHSERREYFGET